MNRKASPHDQELLAQLGQIAQVVDPAPPIVLELARAAFTLRDIDAQLASLVTDSAYELAAVRGAEPTTRVLEFAFADLEMEIQVSQAGAQGRAQGSAQGSLIGQIHSESASVEASIVAESSAGRDTARVDVDELGRFALTDLPTGRIRLRFDRPGLPSVVTPWICPLPSPSR